MVLSLVSLNTLNFFLLGLGLGSAFSAPPPSMLRGKTIEEIVNKWSSDLDSQVREFNKFATEVAVWDRALIENGNSVSLNLFQSGRLIKPILSLRHCATKC